MLLSRTLKKDKILNQSIKMNHSKLQLSNSQNLTKPINELTDYQLKLINYKQSLAKDINHPRIRQIILNHQNIQKLLHSPSPKAKHKQHYKENLTNLQLIEERKWLTKKGKKYLIDFDENQRKQMKACFNAMDIQKNGSVGIDQLQQLLISVGLMDSREDVKQLIDSVDEDKSGKIQFSEFLKMILNDQGQNEEIVQFFKYIINSNRKKNQQEIQWTKDRSKSKERSESIQSNASPNKKKVSLIHNKQNLFESQYFQKSGFHKNRNKFYSSPQKNTLNQSINNRNSALNIFQKHPHPKNLPFGMVVSHIRRKHMMTALKIGENKNLKCKKLQSFNLSSSNKGNNFVSSNALKSSQHMKQSKSSTNYRFIDQEIQKGQSVMNALKKMWDRRLLRELKQKKIKKETNQKLSNCLTEKGKASKSLLPNLS